MFLNLPSLPILSFGSNSKSRLGFKSKERPAFFRLISLISRPNLPIVGFLNALAIANERSKSGSIGSNPGRFPSNCKFFIKSMSPSSSLKSSRPFSFTDGKAYLKEKSSQLIGTLAFKSKLISLILNKKLFKVGIEKLGLLKRKSISLPENDIFGISGFKDLILNPWRFISGSKAKSIFPISKSKFIDLGSKKALRSG